MPQHTYTNADLPRFARKPLGVTVVKTPQGQAAIPPDPVEDPVEKAKVALRRAGQLDQELQDEFNSIDATDGDSPVGPVDSPSVFDTPGQKAKRLLRRVVEPIPRALEKTALVGSFLAPEVAIPSQLVLAASSGKRLASGEDTSTLSKALDTLGLAGGAGAAYASLSRLARSAAGATGNLSATQRVMQGANKAFAGHPNAVTPATGAHMAAEEAGMASDVATRAGEAASNRMLARQMDPTFSPGVVQRVTGLHPKAPRSISTATPISYNTTPISELMDGTGGAFRRDTDPVMRGLMDALDSRISGLPPGGSAGGPLAETGRTSEAAGRYAREGGQFFEGLKREATRHGRRPIDFLKELQSGTSDFVMPSATKPRVR